jgi:chemotaxis protein methyltransferase WspC
MNRLRDTLHASTGLAPSDADLERALRAVLPPAGTLPATSPALGALLSSPAVRGDYAPLPGTPEFEALVDLVVVPESWMLRDPAVFTEALRFVQGRLAARPLRQVRILSVPCAGGEEPYSMALVLAQAGIAPARCRIDAVDLSQAAIARARAGRFTSNAFRGADLAFRERWFTRSGSEYVVDDALRAYVDFSQGNLLAMDGRTDAAPYAAPYQRTQYDLVFCRNLLIYFDAPTRARAAHAIAALLADDGLLLSGHAEAPSFCANGFAPARAGFILHKRAAVQPAADVAPLPPVRRRMRAMAALTSSAPDAPPRRMPPAPPAPPSSEAPQDLLAQARRHADAGRLREAEAACRGLLAATPDSADAWFLLGTVQECGGQPQAADASWRRCVYLAPGHYEALCSLAMLHEGLGDTAAGAGFRQRAARIYARRGSASA